MFSAKTWDQPEAPISEQTEHEAPRRQRRQREREPWPRFFARALLVLGIITLPPAWFFSEYTIGFDPQGSPSLGNRVVIFSEDPSYRPEPGEVVAFRVQGAQPYFEDGELFAKEVMLGPGEAVGLEGSSVVTGDGRVIAQIPPFLKKWALERPIHPLKEDQWWVQGVSVRSWDSRYWGPIEEEQIVGPVHWRLF